MHFTVCVKKDNIFYYFDPLSIIERIEKDEIFLKKFAIKNNL